MCWAQRRKRVFGIEIETCAQCGTRSGLVGWWSSQGRVTTRDMARAHGASPNTLKSTFRSLVGKGLLVRLGGDRSIWYSLASISRDVSPSINTQRLFLTLELTANVRCFGANRHGLKQLRVQETIEWEVVTIGGGI